MNSGKSLLADARALRPVLAARGADFEAVRCIPFDLVEAYDVRER
jgi:hypothetical protein